MELKRRFHEIMERRLGNPWDILRQWAVDEGWSNEYDELELRLKAELVPAMKEEWARQLNEAHGGKLDRPVSTRFIWRSFELMWIPLKEAPGWELRPAGLTEVPNALIFDHKLSDKAVRLYAILRASAASYYDALIATVPIPLLAATLAVTEKTANTTLDELREAGYISDLGQSRADFPRSYKLNAG